MTHHCHAIGCETPCRPELLMCRRHWEMVPRNLQTQVYSTYRKGQCDDKRPSRHWLKAAWAAIYAAAVREGKMTGEEANEKFRERFAAKSA